MRLRSPSTRGDPVLILTRRRSSTGLGSVLERASGGRPEQLVAAGAGDISTGMSEVVTSTTDNQSAAQAADRSAGELAALSDRLQQAISAFRF